MEKRILEYEKFIRAETKSGRKPSKELVEYHREMVADFQHERLIHLIVTLFFAGLTFVMLCITGIVLTSLATAEDWLIAMPTFVLTAILVILTAFYVRHYYFLENHIQGLYDISRKIEF